MVSRAVFESAGGSVASAACTRDSIDCDLVCSVDWMGKVSGPVIRPASMAKNVTDFGDGRRLDHDGDELIDAVNDLGKLREYRL